MDRAHALMRTLADSGIDTLFTNPGTTELHLVEAAEATPGLRSVLALFEGTVSLPRSLSASGLQVRRLRRRKTDSMGAGREVAPPSQLSPGEFSFRVDTSSRRRPGDGCVRRDRRAPQAVPGGGHRRRWRGPRQPECAQRGRADLQGDRRHASQDAGRVRGWILPAGSTLAEAIAVAAMHPQRRKRI